MRHAIAILISLLTGTAYYYMMERTIPTEKNCSFLASPMTDFLAFVWGAIVIAYGYKYDNEILTGLGASVIVEHIWQLTRKPIIFHSP